MWMMNNEHRAQIRWAVLNKDRDHTWEPLDQVKDEISGVLEEFVHTAEDQNLKREALDLCF